MDAIFDEYGGISKPDDYPGNLMSAYETFFIHHFLAGLLPTIRKRVEKTCIHLNSARLQEVVCHAIHAYNRQQEATRKEAMKREQEPRNTIVVWNGRRRGGRGGWSTGRGWQDGCFICGAYDHWRRDCPKNTGYRSRQQQRATGNYCVCFVSQP